MSSDTAGCLQLTNPQPVNQHPLYARCRLRHTGGVRSGILTLPGSDRSRSRLAHGTPSCYGANRTISLAGSALRVGVCALAAPRTHIIPDRARCANTCHRWRWGWCGGWCLVCMDAAATSDVGEEQAVTSRIAGLVLSVPVPSGQPCCVWTFKGSWGCMLRRTAALHGVFMPPGR